MEEIEVIIERIKKALEERNSQMKEQGFGSLQPPETSAEQTWTVTSDCPFNVCDGSGLIWVPEQNGFMICKCQVLKTKSTKLGFARIPVEFENYKISDFDTKIYKQPINVHCAEVAKKTAIQFILKFDVIKKDGKGLYFYSSEKGSGKTRLMASIGNALINQHLQNVRFVSTNNLLDEIKKTFSHSRPEEPERVEDYTTLVKDIKNVDVLLLDDFGAERTTDWVNEIFYSIINDRMTSKKVTLFTSNHKIEELPYDNRIVNRVVKMAIPIKFPEESIRLKLAMDENEQFLEMLLHNEQEE